jgi:hypothetical protein
MFQMRESLPKKYKALGSNPSTKKKRQKGKKKKREKERKSGRKEEKSPSSCFS